MKRILMTSALIGALAVGAFAWTAAQQPYHWAGNPGGGFFARYFLHELNLSADQRSQIKTILQRERPNIQAIAAKLEQQDDRIRQEPASNEAAVRTLAEQQGANVADAIVEREKIRAQIFAILTPEQQQKVNELHGEFRSFLEERIAHLGDQL